MLRRWFNKKNKARRSDNLTGRLNVTSLCGRGAFKMELLEDRLVPDASMTGIIVAASPQPVSTSYQIDGSDRAYMQQEIQRLLANPNGIFNDVAGDDYAGKTFTFQDQWFVSLGHGPVNAPDGVVSDQPAPFIDQARIWQFSPTVSPLNQYQEVLAAQSSGSVTDFYPLLPDPRDYKFAPNDKFFASNQWGQNNTGQGGATPGVDARLEQAWDQLGGASGGGAGQVIRVVDSGTQYDHPDLNANRFTNPGEIAGDNIDNDHNGFIDDVNTGVNVANGASNAFPSLTDPEAAHGTGTVGIAAAVGNNKIGIAGVAFNSKFVPVNNTGDDDLGELTGLSYLNQYVSVSSQSYGPIDSGTILGFIGPLTRAALQNGTLTGYGGKGIVYLVAGGNGLMNGDYSDFDNFANNLNVIGVAALNHKGVQAVYSEAGANLLVTAPAGDFPPDDGVITTDITGQPGFNLELVPKINNLDYTGFNGTSAATPFVAGVVALMREANPSLTPRDVWAILARTSQMVDPKDPDWVKNGAGLMVNHKYGFGLVDANAAVSLAKTWVDLGPEQQLQGSMLVEATIPDDNAVGISRTVTFTSGLIVEKAELILNASHPHRGQLTVTLTSPSGTKSVLAIVHPDTSPDFPDWSFTTVHDMGESATGSWTITVADPVPGDIGTWNGFQLNLFGTAAPPGQPGPGPSPGGNGTGTGGTLGQGSGIFVTAGDVGQDPRVNVYDAKTGALKFSFLAYDQSFRGGVRVALGNVHGAGTDIIVAPGPGGGPNVKVFSGTDGSLLDSFFAYDPSFTGGVFVAAGDFASDGVDDIVTGAGLGGGPHVEVFASDTTNGLQTASPQYSFYAFDPMFSGGISVAVGDLNDDGVPELVTGAGPGGGPQVEAWQMVNGALDTTTPATSFYAYDPSFAGGVFVAVGRATGGAGDDIITGPGSGGGPNVRVFRTNANLALIGDPTNSASLAASFFAFDVSNSSGVHVGVADLLGNNQDQILLAPGGFGAFPAGIGFAQGINSLTGPIVVGGGQPIDPNGIFNVGGLPLITGAQSNFTADLRFFNVGDAQTQTLFGITLNGGAFVAGGLI